MKHIEFEETKQFIVETKPGFISKLKDKFKKKKKFIEPTAIPDEVIDPIKTKLETEIPYIDIDDFLKKHRFYEPNVLISDSAVSVKPQKTDVKEPTKLDPVPITPHRKKDWKVLINMVIGGFALIILSYGAIMINQVFTPHTTVVAGILMVTISSSIIINIIRSF
jgi:hypothetical protein